jgi:hypothetical protein
MTRLTPTALCIVLSFNVACQTDSISITRNDSIPKTDSLVIEELKDNITDNIPVVILDDNNLNDDGTQNISSLLTAGRDPFYTAATFNFSAARFVYAVTMLISPVHTSIAFQWTTLIMGTLPLDCGAD